ncbi:hypothetical protein THAOC_24144 [Thalassiosira oceanica]|uniref:Uncharacterized protein n=1 Tax=Thalassiosira oceanica TaxID=159749 RepID=K0RUE3_THAOC|nr:hypothetical protein THAOC_24144 [Thalassiosira oceanica]|eukprot:EJK56039.1 hypothetical protein THAOC_24144 [Thalassiosira oceanica]
MMDGEHCCLPGFYRRVDSILTILTRSFQGDAGLATDEGRDGPRAAGRRRDVVPDGRGVPPQAPRRGFRGGQSVGAVPRRAPGPPNPAAGLATQRWPTQRWSGRGRTPS